MIYYCHALMLRAPHAEVTPATPFHVYAILCYADDFSRHAMLFFRHLSRLFLLHADVLPALLSLRCFLRHDTACRHTRFIAVVADYACYAMPLPPQSLPAIDIAAGFAFDAAPCRQAAHMLLLRRLSRHALRASVAPARRTRAMRRLRDAAHCAITLPLYAFILRYAAAYAITPYC